MASVPDVESRLHEVDAELTLIAALRDTATDAADYRRCDRAWQLLASDRQQLLHKGACQDSDAPVSSRP